MSWSGQHCTFLSLQEHCGEEQLHASIWKSHLALVTFLFLGYLSQTLGSLYHSNWGGVIYCFSYCLYFVTSLRLLLCHSSNKATDFRPIIIYVFLTIFPQVATPNFSKPAAVIIHSLMWLSVAYAVCFLPVFFVLMSRCEFASQYSLDVAGIQKCLKIPPSHWLRCRLRFGGGVNVMVTLHFMFCIATEMSYNFILYEGYNFNHKK